MATLIDLCHTIHDGLATYPGLPAPEIRDHLTFEQSRERYADGVEFHIGRIDLVPNTGTYLDAPAERPFRFSAVPPKVRGMGTFPVRAWAVQE